MFQRPPTIFKMPHIQTNRDHKALNGGTLRGLGRVCFMQDLGVFITQGRQLGGWSDAGLGSSCFKVGVVIMLFWVAT